MHPRPPLAQCSARLVLILILALIVALVVALAACSSGSSGAAGAAGDGGVASVDADPVLRGRWQPLFRGQSADPPNRNAWVDARAGVAHLAYSAKTQDVRYLQIDATGAQTEVSFPTGTKGYGRVGLLPNGASVVAVFEPQGGTLSAFRVEPGATTPVAAPAHDGSRQRGSVIFELTTLEDSAVVATATATATPSVLIETLATTGWKLLGELPVADAVVSRVRLASSGSMLAVAILSGTSDRHVHVWRNGSWTELAGLPPPSGVIGIPSLLVDGPRVLYLEYQQDLGRSILWQHDGTSWSEWTRSDPKEGFHGLVLHAGSLYTLSGDLPNAGSPVTHGIARLDRDQIARAYFEGETAQSNIDSASRYYVMSYERSQLVSRDGDLYLAYDEESASPASRLYRLVPP